MTQQMWKGGDVTLNHMRCRLDPVHVERVSIRDALGGLSGLKRGGLSALWSKVELIEPTFQVCQPLVLSVQSIITYHECYMRLCSEPAQMKAIFAIVCTATAQLCISGTAMQNCIVTSMPCILHSTLL